MTRRVRRRLSLLLLSCGVLASAPALAQQSKGERVYVDQGCAVCHGLIGEGGVGPRLAGDPFIAFEDYIVARILMGGDEMPSFAGKIPDEDIAAVASYIRQNWGNRFAAVSGQQVIANRQKLEREAAKSGTTIAPSESGGQ